MKIINFDQIQTLEASSTKFMNILAHDMERALALCEETRVFSEKAGYTKGVLDSLFHKAWYHIHKCEFDLVFPLLKDLPEQYKLIGDEYGRLKAVNALGVMHMDMGNYDHALPYFLKSLKLAKKKNLQEREASALANIGLVFNELGKIDQAFDYFTEALNNPEINNTGFYTASKCIGHYYIKTGEYDKAGIYLNGAFTRARKAKDTHFESELLTTQGILNRHREQYRQAETDFKKSLEISKKLGNVKIETENLYELGVLNLSQGHVDKSFSYINQALALAVKKDIGRFQCRCYENLSTMYEENGDYANALEFLKKYNSAEKEYNLMKAELKLKSLEFEHKLEQKQQQAEIYRLKNEELEEANRKIMNLANHDNLTGLPNRRLFMEILKSSMNSALRYDQKIAVLFIDLDNFKPVNDRFGHRAGDYVLKEVGERLIQVLRKSDVVARFGGDEFVILVSELEDSQYLNAIAGKISERFQQDFQVGAHQCNLGASIGISLFPDDDEDIEGLLIKADKAMYAAKLKGKNTHVFYRSVSCARPKQI
ncbi:tetratricopeptide repeat-containing diguanylate cyclase [Desulfopila sp. IMCC35008]|uniref:tetratricopeptide repeat-containing diguanylate cyclase n=1 Tax=Desulfopila sp. IMCC35008 TaxID=2653858 RepID=UPI0013D3CE50|nr:tetratricopeptide repeat-containing diguanylate cyclase [Desulfopila sp. IMCC35008]